MSDIYLYNQKQINCVGRGCSRSVYAALSRMQEPRRATTHRTESPATTHWKLRWRRRTIHGLDFNVSYTWSKCMANSLGYFGSYGDEEGAGESQTQATQNFFQNEYDPKADYGRCTIDIASELWRPMACMIFPSAAAKLFGTNVNRPVNAVIGGWQIAADISLHSGFGITPFAGQYAGDQIRTPHPR